eukprot:359687-Chlamydomonas_euryale.AAC.1
MPPPLPLLPPPSPLRREAGPRVDDDPAAAAAPRLVSVGDAEKLSAAPGLATGCAPNAPLVCALPRAPAWLDAALAGVPAPSAPFACADATLAGFPPAVGCMCAVAATATRFESSDDDVCASPPPRMTALPQLPPTLPARPPAAAAAAGVAAGVITCCGRTPAPCPPLVAAAAAAADDDDDDDVRSARRSAPCQPQAGAATLPGQPLAASRPPAAPPPWQAAAAAVAGGAACTAAAAAAASPLQVPLPRWAAPGHRCRWREAARPAKIAAAPPCRGGSAHPRQQLHAAAVGAAAGGLRRRRLRDGGCHALLLPLQPLPLRRVQAQPPPAAAPTCFRRAHARGAAGCGRRAATWAAQGSNAALVRRPRRGPLPAVTLWLPRPGAQTPRRRLRRAAWRAARCCAATHAPCPPTRVANARRPTQTGEAARATPPPRRRLPAVTAGSLG